MGGYKAEEREWRKIFSFSRPYLKKQGFCFITMLATLILGSLVASISPYLWGKVIDKIALGQVDKLINLLFVYLLLAFFTMGLSFWEGYLGSKLNYKMESEIKQKLMEKSLHLQCKDLDNYDTGFLVSRVVSDASEVSTFVFDVLTSVITITVNIAAALFFSFRISLPLSTVSLAFIPFSIFSNSIFKKAYKDLSKSQREYGDNVSSFHVSTLGHIPEIKAYCLENEQSKKFKDLIDDGWSLQKKQLFLGNKTTIISTLITSSSTATTLILSAYLISNGTFSLGGMAAFQRYIDKLTTSISTLLQMNYSAQSACVAVDRIMDMLSLDDEKENAHWPCPTQRISRLEFKDVSFQYLNNSDVLSQVSFCIDSPGIYALIGENGCGKSTVLKLIMQYYRVKSGHILLNNISTDAFPINALRKSIGYYSKDVYIQDGTLLENLMLGNRSNQHNCDYKILEDICSKIGLLDFICELPEGLETRVGENGKLLSSGQKQKIAIARALLDESTILLFDEMTSDLDGDSEKKIMSIIRNLAKTKIILIVTHRIQSVLFSDHIMVLEDGRITGSGTHQNLLQTSEKYKELFEKQYV